LRPRQTPLERVRPDCRPSTVAQAEQNGSWLVGRPERIIERLREAQARWPGLDHVNVGHPVGTPEKHVPEQRDLFAKQIMPGCTARAHVPTPASGDA
jgi:hypothetical protein